MDNTGIEYLLKLVERNLLSEYYGRDSANPISRSNTLNKLYGTGGERDHARERYSKMSDESQAARKYAKDAGDSISSIESDIYNQIKLRSDIDDLLLNERVNESDLNQKLRLEAIDREMRKWRNYLRLGVLPEIESEAPVVYSDQRTALLNEILGQRDSAGGIADLYQQHTPKYSSPNFAAYMNRNYPI